MKNLHSIRSLPSRMFHRLSMRQKLLYAYALPVLLVSTLALAAGFFSLENFYETRLHTDMEQAMVQADGYVSSYLQGMNYIMHLMQTSDELNDLLRAKEFGRRQRYVDIYQEHRELTEALIAIELSSEEYRIGMYMDDTVLYTNNDYYIYSTDQLEQLPDYEEIIRRLSAGSSVYTILQDKRTSDPDSRQDYLARLMPMNVLEEDGEEATYIIKTEVRKELFQSILRNAAPTEGTILYMENGDEHVLIGSSGGGESLISEAGFSTPYGTVNWSVINLENTQYYYLQRRSDQRGWYLTALIPVREYRAQMSTIVVWLLIMMGAIGFVVALASSAVAGYYAGKIDTLNGKMLNLNEGTSAARLPLPEEEGQDAMDTLYRNFDFMLDEVDQLMKEQYRLGRSVSNAEMRALQAQINPHFLYNTLDLINWGAIDHGADGVAKIARDLGMFYRMSLNHGRSALSIRDELRHVQAFINIENVHYEDAIHLKMDIPEEIQNYACLNITLQPVVENSIVHGIAEFADLKECNILIRASREGEDILFDIYDDGRGIDPAEAEEIVRKKAGEGDHGYGIANVNFRIRLCYGEEYGVSYLFDTEKGTHARVRIKALHLTELEESLV